MQKVIVPDFDGVICDGLDECVLVSWNGYYGKDLSAFSAQGLASIPIEFVERFRHCRNFAKHLGHFIVPFVDFTTPITSQEDFQTIYTAIPPAIVQEFMEKVTDYRRWVREEKEAEWLSHHTLYPGMERFLSNINLPVYIVTAKDGESVRKILSSFGIKLDESQIFGEQQTKLDALSRIAHLEEIHNQELYFFDDNILNVVEARKAGYSAYWATWGYNAPDHFHIARENSVPSVSLPGFFENML